MAKNLLIVESPAKAKTIEKILGSDFEVKSCFGHIRDLEKGDMGIDVENKFQPRYIVPSDKQKVVTELKKIARKTDEVWLATDEDREGEAISWHLCEVLGLDPKKTKRIVFHEITKPAIQKAVSNPRTLDMHLVNAQQARRVIDRIVGFELSPVLWRKMSMGNSLSAGRVQSVAVRLIVEREREINAFQPKAHFKIEAFFREKDVHGKMVTFKVEGQKQNSGESAEAFLRACIQAHYTVKDIQVKPGKKSPAAPFTTSTLQQEASRKLGYGVSKTMLLAQKLYESGYITYMRTDSVSLSDTAIQEIQSQVTSLYGKNYFFKRVYQNKNQSAQEAHEAIRPTYIHTTEIEDQDTKRLYDMIWKRTMASQMADAELEKTIAKIEISTNKEELTAQGEVIKFDGFLKVYREDTDEEDVEDQDSGMLPPLHVKQELNFVEMLATERFSRPAPRYTEASLVKKLEELGIGRPSTYAPTISTIQKRNYIEKRSNEGTLRNFKVITLKNNNVTSHLASERTGVDKNKLFPNDLGLVVTDFLVQHFDDIMDYGFTAKIEEEFDEIADGKLVWNKMVGNFYTPFKADVENTLENAERVKGERELGLSPNGERVIARMGRYGPMVQIGEANTETKPRFAKLKQGQSIETISLDQAMELFKLPRSIGQFEKEEVIINIGRFGPYAAHDKKFYSLQKDMDPYTVTLAEITPLIIEKRKAKEERTIRVFEKEKIQILRGPYGPYIKQGLRNYKLTKEQQENADKLTVEEAKEIIEYLKAHPPKKSTKKKKK